MSRLLLSLACVACSLASTGCGVLDYMLMGNVNCGPCSTPRGDCGCEEPAHESCGCGAARGGCGRNPCCPDPLRDLAAALTPHRLLYGCCDRGSCGDCGSECGGGCSTGHCGMGCGDECCDGPLGLGLWGHVKGWFCGCGCGECVWGYDEPHSCCEPCDCSGHWTGPSQGSYFPRHQHHGGTSHGVVEEHMESVPAAKPTPALKKPAPQAQTRTKADNYYQPRAATRPSTTRSAKLETKPRSKGVAREYRQVQYEEDGFQPRESAPSGKWQPRVESEE
jgi:hypothetical protein